MFGFVVKRGGDVAVRVTLIVGSLVATSCTDGDVGASDAYSSERTYSDGVPVALHRGTYPDGSSPWWISPEPILVITGEEPGVRGLYGIPPERAVARMGSDAFAVINAYARELVFFGRGGDVSRVVEADEGPRSFREASAVFAHPHGGVAVWDGPTGRVVVFDSAGGFEAAVRIESESPSDWGAGGLRGVLPGPSFVMLRALPIEDEADRREIRQRYFVAVYRGDGSLADSVETFVGPPLWKTAEGRFELRPLEVEPQVLVSSNEIFIVDADEGEVRNYDENLRPKRIIRRENPAAVVTQDDIDDFRRRVTDALGSSSAVVQRLEELDDAAWPSLRGKFARTVTGPDGWLLTREPGECHGRPPGCWVAYDPSGVYAGTLNLADDLFIQSFSEGMLIALTWGEMDQQEVKFLHVERR